MLTNFVWPIIDDMDENDLWFQEGGATCHTLTETLNLLRTKFPDRIISYNSAVYWPTRLYALRGSPYPELSKNRFFVFCFNRWDYYQRILPQNFTVYIGIVLMVEFRAVACAERAKGRRRKAQCSVRLDKVSYLFGVFEHLNFLFFLLCYRSEDKPKEFDDF